MVRWTNLRGVGEGNRECSISFVNVEIDGSAKLGNSGCPEFVNSRCNPSRQYLLTISNAREREKGKEGKAGTTVICFM